MSTSSPALTQLRSLLVGFERTGIQAPTPLLAADVTDDVLAARRNLATFIQNDHRLSKLPSLGEGELQALLAELTRLCISGRLQQFLIQADIPHPIYNFLAGFEDNADGGPWDRYPRYQEVSGAPAWDLLGAKVAFPVGIPASGLTANSLWISYFARRGFNVLTYKTVRSRETPPHRYPHWVFLEDIEPWRKSGDISQVKGDLDTWPKSFDRFSTANSFGVPSLDPSRWRPDVELSLQSLSPGQLLILSVMGSGVGVELTEDFVHVAALGAATGVHAIELNLSCPNTTRPDDKDAMQKPICLDIPASQRIVREVRDKLGSQTKLVVKLSYMEPNELTELLDAISSDVDGVSLINTIQTPIRSRRTGLTPFKGTVDDPEWPRKEAGVSGYVVRNLARHAIEVVSQYRKSTGSRFDILGMGGVMNRDDVLDLLNVGADAVQSVSGACLNPRLATDLNATLLASREAVVPGAHVGHGHESEGSGSPMATREKLAAVFDRIGRFLKTGGLSIVDGRAADISSLADGS